MKKGKANPTTPGFRHRSLTDFRGLSKTKPRKSLINFTIKKKSGRNSSGKITIRHRGGGHKRKLRTIDFKRNKLDIQGQVSTIEYDPNRTCNIALVIYQDGDQRYILAPEGLKVGHTVIASTKAEISPGNALPLKNIPFGTPIHNIELTPGKGAQMARSAGVAASIQSKENGFATVQLPSKETRLVKLASFATIGQVGNASHQTLTYGKAGRRRHLGWRPTVRGSAMHPAAHPHGGGEGRSGVGLKHPKTPWGKPALGKKTRKKGKYSDKYIIKDRRIK